ncbi:N-alpha-acetyltransferase 16, NatA auxiliary subunit [Smittium mucronatum]|uniref:N-alpha-acetyltransferase 16, NatA auxiliary subunit n=1 Tax=Smittium mucronatum TaxID=133383 RepID=A0A1R0GRH9_9FUNG|nr:N-alpha-acetyltransferase 16, NatA auxiliary subunit [Smittium mucronatum]
MSLKGLFLFNLGKKDEGYNWVKDGLKVNIMSPISWHIYGLVYRADKKYNDAIRCYLQALKRDPDNLQIYRDLAFLQTQIRDYKGLIVSRLKLMVEAKHNSTAWLGLAVAYHLNGNYLKAIEIIDNNFEVNSKVSVSDYPTSEIYLYKANLLMLAGENQEALEYLISKSDNILDKPVLLDFKAHNLLALSQNDEAKDIYLELISINSESLEFISGYLRSISVLNDPISSPISLEYLISLSNSPQLDTEKATESMLLLQQKFPDSNILQNLPLFFCSTDKFEPMASDYMRKMIVRGVPSLFTSLKSLYSLHEIAFESSKYSTLGNIAESYSSSLKSKNAFSDSNIVPNSEAYIWAEFYCIQHHDRLGNYVNALSRIEALINDSPELAELRMAKAKILKHMGNFPAAQVAMDEARNLELSDRFLNSKTVKYLLRNNKVNEAEEMFTLFVRNDVTNKIQEIFELQANWYLLERARAHSRNLKIGRALVCYNTIIKSFEEYYDDQLDFHSYCLRKSTLRSYIDMIKWGDELYFKNDVFVSACSEYLNCLVQLQDKVDARSKSLKSESSTKKENGKAQKSGSNKKSGSKIKSSQNADSSKTSAGQAQSTEKSSESSFVDELTRSIQYTESNSPLDFALPLLETIEVGKTVHPKVQRSLFEVYLRLPKSLNLASNVLNDMANSRPDPYIIVDYLRLKHAANDSNPSDYSDERSLNITELQTKISKLFNDSIDLSLTDTEILTSLAHFKTTNNFQNSLASSFGFEKLSTVSGNNFSEMIQSSADVLLSSAEHFAQIQERGRNLDIKEQAEEVKACKNALVRILNLVKKSHPSSDGDLNEIIQLKFDKFIESSFKIFPDLQI